MAEEKTLTVTTTIWGKWCWHFVQVVTYQTGGVWFARMRGIEQPPTPGATRDEAMGRLLALSETW